MSKAAAHEGPVNLGFILEMNGAETEARILEISGYDVNDFVVACGGVHLTTGDPVRLHHWDDNEGNHLEVLLEEVSWHKYDPEKNSIIVS